MEMTEIRASLADLVRAARDGDVEAFGEVVRRTQAPSVMAARALIGDRHEAEDAVQDAYLIAFSRLRDLRDPTRFRAWFATILTRLALARRRRPSPPRLGDAQERVPARPAADHARLDALQRAVDRLPDRYRAPVALHYLAGLSYREVAEVLSIPEKRVKSRLHDARARLRRRLDHGS
jgi:RNA polymerase sigma-70 factor (ECF subfamily)